MSMLHNIPFLSLELQASIADMRAAGVSEAIINTLVARIFAASEAKTANLQESIIRIEDGITTRMERLSDKLIADNQAHHGATNEMLSALHAGQLDVKPIIIALSDGLEVMRAKLHALQADFDARTPLFAQIIQEIQEIHHAAIVDQVDREERLALVVQLRVIVARWPDVEALLDDHAH